MILKQNQWTFLPYEHPSHPGYHAGKKERLCPTANWAARDCCNLEEKVVKSILAEEEVDT